jgi:purine-binding chemotaxis protein CheW
MTETDATQVLRFALGEDDYCIPIDYVSEIVDGEAIQSLPNAEPHVEGVTDLRGQTTTVVDPSVLLNVDTDELVTDGGRAKNRIIVLDSEALGIDSATSWLVSAVNDVREIGDGEIDTEGTTDNDLLRGFLKDDAGFTLWIDPREFTA